MTHLARLSALLLTGGALSLLAACGPGAPPPAAPAPAETVVEDIHDTHSEDPADGEAHAQHEGEDHDPDHEEDHAGGAAHVHGIADLAFVVEGGKLTAEMMSPLANFGLSEADGVFSDEVKAALPGLITLTGGDCTAETPVAEVDNSSGHTDGQVSFSWTCADVASVSAARFAGFAVFPDFETINAVFIGDTVQKAAELTPSSPELSLK